MDVQLGVVGAQLQEAVRIADIILVLVGFVPRPVPKHVELDAINLQTAQVGYVKVTVLVLVELVEVVEMRYR